MLSRTPFCCARVVTRCLACVSPVIKEAYSHTVHVYVLIHYSDFIHVRSPAFTNGLAATFDYLVAYGGLVSLLTRACVCAHWFDVLGLARLVQNTRSTNVAHAMINSLIRYCSVGMLPCRGDSDTRCWCTAK